MLFQTSSTFLFRYLSLYVWRNVPTPPRRNKHENFGIQAPLLVSSRAQLIKMHDYFEKCSSLNYFKSECRTLYEPSSPTANRAVKLHSA